MGQETAKCTQLSEEKRNRVELQSLLSHSQNGFAVQQGETVGSNSTIDQ